MGLFDFLRSEKRGDNFLRAVFGGYGAANKTAVNRVILQHPILIERKGTLLYNGYKTPDIMYALQLCF